MTYQRANEFLEWFHRISATSYSSSQFEKWFNEALVKRELIRILSRVGEELLIASNQVISVNAIHVDYLEVQVDVWYDWITLVQGKVASLNFGDQMKEQLNRSVIRVFTAIHLVDQLIIDLNSQESTGDYETVTIDSSLWSDDPTWLTRLCGYRNRSSSEKSWRRNKLEEAIRLVDKELVVAFLMWMIERNQHRSYMHLASERWQDDINWLKLK